MAKLKKAHWHILLSYDGPVNLVAVKKLTDKLNAPNPQKISSSKGLVRYMAHLDNPEKFQYSVADIKGHNGADIAAYFELTATNKLAIMKELSGTSTKMALIIILIFDVLYRESR